MPEVLEKPSLRVLLVEDSRADAELVTAHLSSAFELVTETVQTADDMRRALDRSQWDLILSDFSMPSFDAPQALRVLQDTQADIPFIILSGTIGEDAAVASLKAGACDFLIKDKLARLIPAIERELREARSRRERAMLAERLRQSEKLEALGRLAGGIAHDFNNLLTVMLGSSEMLLEQIGPDKPIRADLEEIARVSHRAAALTRQLLAFSRGQAINPTVVNLNQVILDMRNLMVRLIREDIETRFDLVEQPLRVMGDRGQIEQVIMNLVTNAGDAMPSGGLLKIETALVGQSNGDSSGLVQLRVADTGSGMDADTQAHIFEPFFTTKPLGKGTGLGLPTVYGIVRQLGGTISVSSNPGQGTAFLLEFPEVHATAETPHRPAVQRSAPIADHHETVLVVDDEAAVRLIISRVLQRHGYRVFEAQSAAEALATIEQQPVGSIQLVISDVVMPMMHGPEMVYVLRRQRPEIRALFVSGYPKQARSAITTGDSFLEKPFTAVELLTAVRASLDQSFS